MKFRYYNPNFLALATLVILSILALKSLAIPDFYTSHDGETHTARIAQYYQAIVDGQYPPRLAETFNNGLGSPIFVYVYPMPYILGSTIHFLGFSFTDSFEIIMALAFIFSSVFSYLWLREVVKSEKAAFLGALFYVWVPYRFLLIYVRGSISENLAYTFLPLVLYAFTKLSYEKNNLRWLALSAISIGLLLLSQNLVAMFSITVIVGYVLILAILTKSLRFFANTIVASVWGLAIASFTYLPAFFERNFVHFDQILRLAYGDHFVTLKQLIRSPWGYGFDLVGTVNDQISFQMGLTHILILILSILVLLILLIKKVNIIRKIDKFFLENPTSKLLMFAIFFLFLIFLTIFLMIDSHQTRFVWQNFKPLGYIDLPWRLLGITALSTSFLAAFLARVVKPGIFFIFLVALVIVANRNHLRINQTLIRDDDFFKNYTGHATQYGEFTSKWRETTRIPIGFDPNIKAEVVLGQLSLSDIFSKSSGITFSANVTSPNARIRINKIYFPKVQVSVDGKQLKLFEDLIITGPNNLRLDQEQDTSGLMLVNLNSGIHKITVKYGETPLRLVADYLSLGSLILAAAVTLKNAKK